MLKKFVVHGDGINDDDDDDVDVDDDDDDDDNNELNWLNWLDVETATGAGTATVVTLVFAGVTAGII